MPSVVSQLIAENTSMPPVGANCFQLGLNFSVTPGGFRHTSSHVSVYLCGWVDQSRTGENLIFSVSRCFQCQLWSLPTDLTPSSASTIYRSIGNCQVRALCVLILGGFILLIDGLTHYTQGARECIIENGLWFLFIYLFEFLISLSPPSLTLLFVALFQCWACCCFKSVEKRETYLCSKWVKRWSSRSPMLSPSS